MLFKSDLISSKCNTGQMSPLCGARDEQVGGKSDHGEEEGGRCEFSLALIVLFMTPSCVFV